MTSILDQFASEVAQAPKSYAQTYSVNTRYAPNTVKPTSVISSSAVRTPSAVSGVDFSSLANVENYFSGFNTEQNYATNYPVAERTAPPAAKDPSYVSFTAATPFNFANSLFEGQQTPESTKTVLADQGSSAGQFLKDTLSFLAPRVTQTQATDIIGEFGSSSGPGAGAGPLGAPSSPGPAAPDSSTIIPPSTTPPPGSTAPPSPPDQPQTPGTQAPGSGLGFLSGGGDSSSSPSSSSSGFLDGLLNFIHQHPLLSLGLVAGSILVFGGGGGGGYSGGKKRR